MTAPPDEGWWVLRAQAGDIEALELLLTTVQAPLLRFVTRMVVNPAAAEDVLQDVMFTISCKIQWLDRPEAFRAWAYRIASRQALAHLRGEERDRHRIDPQADLDDLEAAGERAADVVERLPELLAHVSPSSRIVLALHYLEEQPLDAVAAILGIPLGTVKSRLAYGLKTLRQRINPAEGRP